MANTGNIKYSGNSRGGLDFQAQLWAAADNKVIDDAMSAIERENPTLKGVLPCDYARPSLDKVRLGGVADTRFDAKCCQQNSPCLNN